MRSLGPLLLGVAAIALARPAHAGEIEGRLTDPDGKPLAGARVVVDDLQRGDISASDGRFQIAQLPAGAIRITVTSPGFASETRTIAVPSAGSATIALQLRPNDLIRRAAALNVGPAPEHLPQKAAYLRGVKPPRGKQPNILLILFDDLGAGDLSSYGNRLIKTPNVDAIAARGLKLDQFYSSSPVCTPSRAALLTGRYPTRAHAANHVYMPTGTPTAALRASRGWANALPRDEILLPEVLQRAGYRTGAFGKWHLGDIPGHRPRDFGFQDYFGLLYSNDMNPTNVWRGDEIVTPAAEMDQATINERIADEAIGFIGRNAAGPFFAYVPFSAPHWPHVANPRHKGVSAGGTYGDVVEDLDHQVGRIMAKLHERGLDDDTIVIVTSDNGGDFDGSVGPLRGRKTETFEGGMRVPAIVIWPGRTTPGTTSDEMAMNIDILPTILSNLGIGLPQDRIIDGADMAPILRGGQSLHDRLFYVSTWSGQYEAVRDRAFKFRDPVIDRTLISPPRGGAARPALYSLADDNEAHDVSARHPDERTKLQAQLEEFRTETSRNVRGWINIAPRAIERRKTGSDR